MATQNPALDIAAAVNSGTSAVVAVEASLRRAEADTLNAVIRVHRARALAAAAAVDARVAAGERLPLAGVPMVIKDNILIEGLPATCCSKILTGFVAPYSATAIARLEHAGAIVVAQANMDEFAMGSSNETSVLGPVKNPHDPTRIPGGSSGGSAASVASGIAPVALGSDTGGSIRQPASLCGCVGFKPTYGAVSRYGLIAFGSSLDQIGPFTTTVADTHLVMSVMAGADLTHDATSNPHALALPALDADALSALRGARIGVCRAHRNGLAPDVLARLDAAESALRQAGATIVEVSVPHEHLCVAVYYVIATGEAASNLSRFDGVRFGHRTTDPSDLNDLYARSRAEGFGPEVQRRILLGTYVLSSGYYDAYYQKAQQVRQKLCDDFARAFAGCDAILGPTSPVTAFKRGERLNDPLQMYLSDVFTIAANLAGIPAISVPFGRDSSGLPIGLQLQSPMGSDGALLRLAAALETLGRRS